MWLLDTSTLKLRQFVTDVPDYVILSHTWGEGEVGFDDIAQPYVKEMNGYTKISQCCAKAVQVGFEWAWIDTCCIDKRSSAELSEAINSMYKWYWDAAICYAYISDWSAAEGTFQSSRWFKRGWTLQELLAPDVIEIFDSDWHFMGTKSSLLEGIHKATNIKRQYLLDQNAVQNASIAAKFSWASGRTTTREEDMAYCLLGLVHVNMPMLYGEGSGAFYRLQLEIIKQTNEHTIFAWESTEDTWHQTSIFASSPSLFKTAASVSPGLTRAQGQPASHEITNHGLRITLPCIPVDNNRVVALLECTGPHGNRVGIWLEDMGCGLFRRPPLPRVWVTDEECKEATLTSILIESSSRNRQRAEKKEYSMKLNKPWGDGRVIGVAKGTPSAVLTPPMKLSSNGYLECDVENLRIRDSEFVCLLIERSHWAYREHLVCLGLYKGRPWTFHKSPCDIANWVTDVREVRKQFETQTQDQACSMQQDCSRDLYFDPVEEGEKFRVLARKTRSEKGLEWVITMWNSGMEPQGWRRKPNDTTAKSKVYSS
jgi:hypothetical protein